MKSVLFSLAAAATAFATSPAPSAAAETTFRVSLPIACKLHETCWLQNYVDTDAGPAARDYRCNGATYDGHKGTDFRIASAAHVREGVAVRAAAPGRVKAFRDGVADELQRDARAYPSKRACGNGVVIDHGDGWETQYCHLRKGSIGVRRGQTVARGDKIGEVGYSGAVEFAHLHFSLRKDGKTLDPFTAKAPNGACSATAEVSGLWDDAGEALLDYRAGELIEAAFTGAPPPERREVAGIAVSPFAADSPALILAARFINLRKGDILRLRILGPGEIALGHESKPMPRDKAEYVIYAGRKLKAGRWPQGKYLGTIQLLRDGKPVVAREMSRELD